MNEQVARLKQSHAYRSWERYTLARGNVIASGVGYLAFFSAIPATTLGLTVLGFVLRGNEQLQAQVVEQVNSYLPGLLKTSPTGSGLISPDAVLDPSTLTVTGIVSVVVLLITALGWLDAVREGMRAVFDQPVLQGNPVRTKLRDLGVLASLGLAILVSTIASQLVSGAAGTLLGWVGLSGTGVGSAVVGVLGVLVVLAVDFAIFLLLLRLLPGIDIPRQDLRQGAIVGAIGLGILKLASGLLLAQAGRKPGLAPFAVLVGLLVWTNLVARVTVLAAAWAATTAQEKGLLVGAARAALPAPAGPREALLPSFGQRSADRTTLAAGAVLGLSAAVAARTAARAARAVGDAVRRP